MVLYTIVPEHFVFPEDEKNYLQYQEISINGIPMIVQQNNMNYEIIRVLSTEPQDYLAYQPGQKIHI